MSAPTPDQVGAFVLMELREPLVQLGLEPDHVTDDFDMLTTGVIDSLGLIELIVAVNERFGLDIDFEEIDPEGLTVVGSFSRYVAEQGARGAAA